MQLALQWVDNALSKYIVNSCIIHSIKAVELNFSDRNTHALLI